MRFLSFVRAKFLVSKSALLGILSKVRAVIPALTQINRDIHSIDQFIIPMFVLSAVVQGFRTFATFMAGGFILSWLAQSFQKGGIEYKFIVPILIAVAVGTGIKEYFTQRLLDRDIVFSEAFSQKFEMRLMSHLSSLDLATLLSPDFDKKSRLVSNGIYTLKTLFKNQFEFLSAIIAVITGLGALLIIDPWMLIVVILPIIPSVYISGLQTQADRKYWLRRQIYDRRNSQYFNAVSDPENLAQSKMFGMVGYFTKKYFTSKRMFVRFSRFKLRVRAKGKVLLQMFQVCAINGVLLYLVVKASRSGNPMFNMMVVAGALNSLQSMVSHIPHLFLKMVQTVDNEYADIKNFFDIKPQINEDGCRDYTCRETPVVEMKEVSFTYPYTNKEVLSGCSFALREGDCIALVGPNGCGKTTITMLLSKMYLPNSGDITFDGQSLSELKQESLYKHLVYLIPQAQVERLQIDIALTGVEPKHIDYEKLSRALELVGMDEIVRSLPNGYQTQIGVNWGGVSFSTGQFQRLMIAAALYRAFDPAIKIVIFDEPMAHCDVEIKRMFYDSLKGFPEKIVLVIAHDPLYLSFFNRVISMKDGRIIADVCGQHAISEITDSVIRELAVDL